MEIKKKVIKSFVHFTYTFYNEIASETVVKFSLKRTKFLLNDTRHKLWAMCSSRRLLRNGKRETVTTDKNRMEQTNNNNNNNKYL